MGESKKAFAADSDVKLRTHVGGQALIEGIMMRGRYNWAVAVREPDGNIYTEEHDLVSGRKKNSWMYWPVIRGCTAFVESLVLGYKALQISSEHAYDWEEEDDEPASGAKAGGAAAANAKVAEALEAGRSAALSSPEAAPGASASAARSETPQPSASGGEDASKDEGESEGLGIWMTISMLVGIVLGVVIFVVAPAALSNLVLGEEAMNTAAWNIFDGVVRVIIFIAYIWLISLMKDIRRMFAYHGAEHKTIHCFEHGDALVPENAMKYPRLHVRCGTAFMIMVMIIAIFVYTVLGQPINSLVDMTGVTEGPLRFVLIVLTRVVLMPIIAGLSYEVTVKWAGQRPDNPLVRIILWPGMQMQRLTTNPPDESMIECAIKAMELVLAREEREEEAAELEKATEQELASAAA